MFSCLYLLQKAFKSQAPTPSSSPVPDEGPSAPFPPQGVASFTPEQKQKVESFCHQSGMNAEWSAKYVSNILFIILWENCLKVFSSETSRPI